MSDLDGLLISENLTLTPWTQGYLRIADGTIGSDPAQCVSNYFSSTSGKVSLSVASGFVVVKICEYSTKYGAFVQTFTDLNITGEAEFNTVNGHFYRLQLCKEDESTLAPNDISENTVIISTKTADKAETVFFKGSVTVPVSADLASRATVTLSQFTGSVAEGFTHNESSAGRIQLSHVNITQGNYILEFDTDYTAGEFVRCGFANDYKNYAYNGSNHIVMPLINTDGNKYLYIDSVYDGAYTLTNLKLRKIDVNGDSFVTLAINSILNLNNTDNLGFWNVILGYNTADKAVGSSRMIAIGNNALARLQGGHRNIGIGTFAMSQMTGGEGNVSMGADSMLEVQSASHNVAIGREACYKGDSLTDNVAVGHSALFGASGSTSYYNVAVGSSAGAKVTGHWGTFVGHQAGYNITSGYGNTMLGFNTLGNANGYDNTCIGKQSSFNNGVHSSTAIGAGAVCTKSNQVVIGGSNVTEYVLNDKKIIFNEDGTVSWEAIS